ncbi:MAG TPA: DEAD/DEAH box helicase [Trebonia sp.]|jgi:ATP-dependent RNA helicase DeaD|nr:DEAD/DEAH box helicase [Trebonia sp.]
MTENNNGEAAGFADLLLAPELCRALAGLGYEEPTPIQRAAIPPLLDGRDLVGQAATGTGKTAAFALPILQRILAEGGQQPEPLALVLVPTRELAVQVAEAMHSYSRDMGARVLAVYGGEPIGRQLGPLRRGVDVVVATPGRAIDHINRGTLKLSGLAMVVLDEADEMLDMGFADDIEEILGATPDGRQTALFSATMPPRINGMVRRHLSNPARVELGRQESESADGLLVRQTAYVVPRGHKATALGRVLDLESPTATVVFCRTRDEVDQLTEALNGRGYRAEALHGGMDQHHRDRVMNRLRSQSINLLVATDVAARGLDIDQLTHVVNYDVPSAPESYVHRIGRVGRAGREGTAITLVEPREHRMLKVIERTTKQPIKIEKLPTVADLRARRLELTAAKLRESLTEGVDLDEFRAVVEPLSAEFDLFKLALAAVKLAHEAGEAPREEEELPEVELPSADERRGGRTAGGRELPRGAGRGPRRGRGPTAGTTRLFVGTGRAAGVRPQDLVGAITGKSYLSGRDIGTIEIADRFSLVEVPESAADDVVAALRQAGIRGRSATVRRERYEAR